MLAEDTTKRTGGTKGKILLLSLVHPDFLPPVYTSAQTLRDEGYDIHLLTFDSFVQSSADCGPGIVVESVGKHHNIPFFTRLKMRRQYRKRVAELVSEKPDAIIACCRHSFVYAIGYKKRSPVVYYALEIADFKIRSLLRSPVSAIGNYKALRSAHKANMVITPSVQRSAWLAGRCRLSDMPATVLNTAYVPGGVPEKTSLPQHLVPPAFMGKKVVLYTGAINERLCVQESVQAFDQVNDPEAVLIITGMKDNAYCRQLTAIVDTCASRDRIKLLPYVTREEMLYLQQAAHIGFCLAREYKGNLDSQMGAPNKVGEYLAKGVYLVGITSQYMRPLQENHVASLADSAQVTDIARALKHAIQQTAEPGCAERISKYVMEDFRMEIQLRPLVRFLSDLQHIV